MPSLVVRGPAGVMQGQVPEPTNRGRHGLSARLGWKGSFRWRAPMYFARCELELAIEFLSNYTREENAPGNRNAATLRLLRTNG